MKKKKNGLTIVRVWVILNLIGFTIFMIFGLAFNSDKGGGMAQYLRHLDYQVQMNNDGSMDIIETWDIDVGYTNTLVRTFNLDENKFGKISNVEIIDLQNQKKFVNIEKEMYHVPEGEFYALEKYRKEFEIAFGVGMDKVSGNRKFQISYTVEDVVTDYKDCQEIYWQFLAEGQNAIPAGIVTGKLTLPEQVTNTDNLLVWGHGQINGTIEKINNSQVEFEINNLSSGAMLEIRVITKEKMFEVQTNKTKNYETISAILTEENDWARTTNQEALEVKTLIYIVLVIYAILIIRLIIKIKKALEIQKSDSVKTEKLEYFRDIPREKTATPAEAAYLYQYNKTRLDTGKVQAEAVSATILDLCYKKKIELRVGENETVYIKVISDSDGLKEDELEIYNLLKQISKNGEEFEINELKKFANKKYLEYSNIINSFINSARNSLYSLGLIDKSEEKLYATSDYAKSKMKILGYGYLWTFMTWVIINLPIFKFRIICYYGTFLTSGLIKILIAILPLALAYMCYWKLQGNIRNKISVLTSKGREEKSQWYGLANYMREYSLLNEKDVLSLSIWEKYLIYATAFGIEGKVIKQMKAQYPEVFIKEKWDDENMARNYPVIYFVSNPMYTNNYSVSHSIISLGNGVSRAYSDSMSQIAVHNSSNGSGGGGGFSSGGGGRRWPEAGMGGR